MNKVERHKYRKENDEWVISETRSLEFEPYSYTTTNVDYVMKTIKSHLTTKMLGTKYREEAKTNPLRGHCYHSVQAMYYLIDTNKLISMRGPDCFDDWHWWLQDEKKILDITADQYYNIGRVPPYKDGKNSNWTGWKFRPQQKSLDLMKLVLGEKNYVEKIEKFETWPWKL